VNWALRSVGKRNAELHAKAVAVSVRLAASQNPTARWCGKDALRELSGASVARRLASVASKRAQKTPNKPAKVAPKSLTKSTPKKRPKKAARG
jgi:hypothetical protein